MQQTVAQLVKKFSAFYGTQEFITLLTTAHVWILPELDYFIPQDPSTFVLHFNITLKSKPRSCRGYLLVTISDQKKFVHISDLFLAHHMCCPFNPI
jgi:hypothetical protein